MKRKIAGKCLIVKPIDITTGVLVRGTEHCTPDRMKNVLGLVEACGFTKVVSHSGGRTSLGDGTNVLAIYNSSMSNIVNDMRRPTSVIVVPVGVTGTQLDSHFKASTKTLACKDTTENKYSNKSGAIIVASGKVIGIYCTAKNLLVTTDVTHYSSGPFIVGQILTELLKYKVHYKIGGSEKITLSYTKQRAFARIEKDIMIGLDPELGILNKSGMFVGSPYTGREIGRDVGDVVELRPQPGSVKDVIENVRTLYKSMGKTLRKDYRLVSGGGRCIKKPLGGHIHFNIPSDGYLTAMLDDYIGRPLQRVTGSERVGGSGYGALGATSNKTHGFEYRTPPSFVGKPDLFAGVIAVAFCVASTWKTLCNRGSIFEYDIDATNGALAEAYTQLTYYKRYKKHIDAFLEYVNNKELSMEETDVLAAWAIREAVCLEDISI